MSTFEEQFPELVSYLEDKDVLGPVVRVSQIKIYCLSKQRVREAISVAKFRLKGNREIMNEFDIIEQLEKELGL